jgi:hypothetical protein
MRKFAFLLIGLLFSPMFCRAGKSADTPATSSPSPHLLPVKIEGKWGFINLNGRIVIPAQYYNKPEFSEGVAAVCLKGLWGFIDETGRFVLEPRFHETRSFKNGYAAVRSGKKWEVIDRKGIPFDKIGFDEVGDVSEGKFFIRDGKHTGYIDIPTRMVIVGSWDYCDEFSSGLAKVSLGDLVGFIDGNGKMVIKPRYSPGSGAFSPGTDLIPFGIFEYGHEEIMSDGTPARQRLGPKYGFIGRNGYFVIKPEFSSTDPFHEDLACISNDDKKYGFVDSSGKVIIAPQFDWADGFSESMACIKSEGLYGFINKSGAIVIKPQFITPSSFHHGLAIVNRGGEYGLIDAHGDYRVSPQYTKLEDFNGRAVYYEKEGEYGYLDSSGRIIWSYQKQNASKANNHNFLMRFLARRSSKEGHYEMGTAIIIIIVVATILLFLKRWLRRHWIYIFGGCFVFLVTGYGLARWSLAKIEDSEWKIANTSNTATAIKQHVLNWPDGKYADVAASVLSAPVALPYKASAKGERASASGSFAFSGISAVPAGSLEHALSTIIPVDEDLLVMDGTLNQFMLDGVIIDLESTSYHDGIVHTKYFGNLKCKLDRFTPSDGASLICSCSLDQREALHEFVGKSKSLGGAGVSGMFEK